VAADEGDCRHDECVDASHWPGSSSQIIGRLCALENTPSCATTNASSLGIVKKRERAHVPFPANRLPLIRGANPHSRATRGHPNTSFHLDVVRDASRAAQCDRLTVVGCCPDTERQFLALVEFRNHRQRGGCGDSRVGVPGEIVERLVGRVDTLIGVVVGLLNALQRLQYRRGVKRVAQKRKARHPRIERLGIREAAVADQRDGHS
jgi:hypothetical protein